MSTYTKHVKCIADFCGNWKSPGVCADIYENAAGKRRIYLGGGWRFYAPKTPAFISESSPHFRSFLAACNAGDDLNYAERHWR